MPRDLRHDVELLRHQYGLLGRHGVKARHGEKSMIFSADDESRPSERLVDVALDAVGEARGDLARSTSTTGSTARRTGRPSGRASTTACSPPWPASLEAETVVEIGTATGMSALALLAGLPEGGRVVTYDLVAWREYPGTVLRDEDFADGRLEQHLDDLSTPGGLAKHRDLLAGAGLVFVDAAKDGKQEQRFLDLFETIPFTQRADRRLRRHPAVADAADLARGAAPEARPHVVRPLVGHGAGRLRLERLHAARPQGRGAQHRERRLVADAADALGQRLGRI